MCTCVPELMFANTVHAVVYVHIYIYIDVCVCVRVYVCLNTLSEHVRMYIYICILFIIHNAYTYTHFMGVYI